MGTERTQSAILGDLQRLSAVLTENADELQLMGGAIAELESVVRRAQAAAQRQAALAASRMEATEEFQRLLREGSRLGNSVRQQLKYLYGIGSNKLVEFGMQPYRGRKPSERGEPEAGPETTSA
jgi:hypothetical protein